VGVAGELSARFCEVTERVDSMITNTCHWHMLGVLYPFLKGKPLPYLTTLHDDVLHLDWRTETWGDPQQIDVIMVYLKRNSRLVEAAYYVASDVDHVQCDLSDFAPLSDHLHPDAVFYPPRLHERYWRPTIQDFLTGFDVPSFIHLAPPLVYEGFGSA